jgi:uncharacterized protein
MFNMPHQCVKCSKFYPDNANEIISGCECGARLFFFVKKQKIDEAKNFSKSLTQEEKDELEKDVFDILDTEKEEESPVVLDFESIRIPEPGKYEIDLESLFNKEPIIYSIDEGKYFLDLKHAFEEYSKPK